MAEDNKTASLRDFLYVFFKHKTKILTVFVATVIAVAVGTFTMKPIYEARSKVLIKFGRENMYIPATANGSNPIVNLNNREEEINSEIEILNSRNLIEKAVKSLGVENIYPELLEESKGRGTLTPFDTTVLIIQKKLQAEGIKKSNVINVKFEHHDPNIAANVVNSLVNFYLDQHLNVHKNQGGYAFFEEQVAVAEKRLRTAEEALEEFKGRNGISSLEQQKNLILQQTSELNADLKKTRRQIRETESMIAEIERQLAGDPQEIAIGMEMDRNPHVITSLRQKLIDLQSIEQQLLTKYREQSRTVQNKRREIGKVKQALAKEELTVYEADLKALRVREASQRNHLSEYQKELNRLNDLEMGLRDLQRQREMEEKHYRLCLTKFEESRMSDTMDTERIANVSVVEKALVPLRPVKPNKLLNLALGIALGMLGGLGLAFFSEFMDHSISTQTDFEKLGMPLLASIPEFKTSHRRSAKGYVY